jgi:protein-disulfide isomerase
MPLESIHKLAFKASQATHCAGDQNKFWEMHERLFANQRNLEPWDAHARAIGLDVDAFTACLDNETYAKAVRADMAEGRKAGVSGTPSFVLALTDPDNPTQVEGLSFIRGAQPFTRFQSIIDQALKSLETD